MDGGMEEDDEEGHGDDDNGGAVETGPGSNKPTANGEDDARKTNAGQKGRRHGGQDTKSETT